MSIFITYVSNSENIGVFPKKKKKSPTQFKPKAKCQIDVLV